MGKYNVHVLAVSQKPTVHSLPIKLLLAANY